VEPLRHRFAILLAVAVVALGVLVAPPARAEAAGEHWIDVNLTTLRARAWDGDTVVYAAPVTSGRPGWETPTATFSVLRRVHDATMDSATLGIPHNQPGGWNLRHVYFTRYFTDDGHAIHYN
jgi:lipoprotein-anchoring transpeptidase ErfK/SrfK